MGCLGWVMLHDQNAKYPCEFMSAVHRMAGVKQADTENIGKMSRPFSIMHVPKDGEDKEGEERPRTHHMIMVTRKVKKMI